METIQFDSGIREYQLKGLGVLRFHPGDPNLYARFMESADMISQLQTHLEEKGKQLENEEASQQVLKLLEEADRQMKQILNWVFGPGNDFDKLLGGVNLLSMGQNGQRLITNLLTALEPVLVEGAKQCAREASAAAVARAEARRSQQ